jgi:hypothetical protein
VLLSFVCARLSVHFLAGWRLCSSRLVLLLLLLLLLWLVCFLPARSLAFRFVRYLVVRFRSLLGGCFSSCLWCLSLLLGGFELVVLGACSPFLNCREAIA